MPDAIAVSVAQAVVDEINGLALSQTVTAERSYFDWTLELKDSDKLFVDVVASMAKQTLELESRGRLSYRIPVDIVVRWKFGQDATDDDTGRIDIDRVDSLILLVQQLAEFSVAARLTGMEDAAWESTTLLATPDPKSLRESNMFLGVVRVAFVVPKDKS